MTSISGLPSIGSIQTDDFFPILDVHDTSQAPSGTSKKISLASLRTFYQSLVMTPFVARPSAPTATASTAALVMMGLGSTFAITPKSSGLIEVTLVCQALTNTAAVQCTIGARYGTGTAPANGAAVTGTRWGNNGDFVVLPPSTAAGVPICFNDLIQLTPGTAYWLDLCMLTSNASDTAVPKNICFTAIETS